MKTCFFHNQILYKNSCIRRAQSKRVSFIKDTQGGPTVKAKIWDVQKQVKALKKNLGKSGFKRDMAIAEIIIPLTYDQRERLQKEYRDQSKGKDLREQFYHKKRREAKPGFNKTMQLCLATDAERDAMGIHHALKMKPYNFNFLVEILAVRHSDHIRHIKQVYEQMYPKYTGGLENRFNFVAEGNPSMKQFLGALLRSAIKKLVFFIQANNYFSFHFCS